MLNSVNTFNNAKALNESELLRKYNKLIDILQQQIKMLSASIANGITVDTTGVVELGLASATSAGALSSTDWSTFNDKQTHSNELDGLSSLEDTAGFVKKTGDGAYSIDTTTYTTLAASDNNAIAYAIALG